ncbi:TlpA family protein disulfide reductase [Aeromicrobium phragmitis]|uniref:TlpA family protein disulfide reductase n=1 Tax=Aeromicrobium phragmitis TaxID=2478914 RepID=A0A3L8PLZ1_9ACTN|nr:TlpA disulfide reductase family protein [Aeromicrobium phragmitis]RLV56280.1 TlpA family protein disulfide reductase [Aeromicrobium phragmitis]
MSRRPLLAVVAVLAIILASACSGAPAVEGTTAKLSGEDLNGSHHDIADYAGEVVIVTVWASWCAPCRDEVPVLTDASERFGPEGLRVLGINFRDNADAARTFAAEAGITYPSIVDLNGAKSIDWGVVGIPQSFLVNREGVVVDRVSGTITEEWIASRVVEELRQ